MSRAPHRRPKLSIRRGGLLASLALAMAACGGDAGNEASQVASDDPTAATLVLGGDTVRFQVDACDANESTTATRPTLIGHANLADGRSLQVTVLRIRIEAMNWQSVALDFGSEYWEARRGQAGGGGEDGWRDFAADFVESGLGPLVTFHGDSIHAEGRFQPAASGQREPTHGTLTAECPAS